MNSQVVRVTANYTFEPWVKSVLVTTGASAITVTLPDATVPRRTSVLVISKIDSGAGSVTISPIKSQTISGQTSLTLAAQYQKVTLLRDGDNWKILDAAPMFINDNLRAQVGGGRSLRVVSAQATGALTGTNEALAGRAENRVNTMTGKIVGVSGYAANYNASAGGTVHAGEFWALTKGVNCGTVRAIEAGLDFDGGETVTEATVLRVVSQAAGTITSHYGINIVDDSSSSPGGKAYTAFIRCDETSAATTPGAIIDASGVVGYNGTVAGIALTAGDTPLFAYKDKDGTQHVLVISDADAVAIRT